MVDRDHSFAAALVMSLLLHAGMVLVVADRALSQAGRVGPVSVSPAVSQDVAYVAPAAPPPPQRLEKLLFGNAAGRGDGVNARPGDDPLVGRLASQTQAFLSRDPLGPGEIMKEPSMSVLPTGSAGKPLAAITPPPAPPPMPPMPPLPFGAGDRAPRWSAPLVKRPPVSGARPAAESEQPAATPGAPLPAADPAVMSDSESDPFVTRAGDDAVEFRDGRVEVRFGRKVKTVRPHLSFASRLDLLGMRFPQMIVRVHIHRDGTVRRVDIVKSTGSPSADQEVKIALYQWWFEPTDESVVEFPITWR